MPNVVEIYFTDAVEKVCEEPFYDFSEAVRRYEEMLQFPEKYQPGFFIAKDKGSTGSELYIVRLR